MVFGRDRRVDYRNLPAAVNHRLGETRRPCVLTSSAAALLALGDVAVGRFDGPDQGNRISCRVSTALPENDVPILPVKIAEPTTVGDNGARQLARRRYDVRNP